MRTRHWGWIVLAAVALGAVSRADDDEEVKAAQKDVLALAKDVAAGKATDRDIAKKAGRIARKYEELHTVMHVYKPKAKGGIGYGKDGAGIELKIIGLGKRRLTAAALAKEKDELVKMADINIAVAEIAMPYAPSKPKGGRGAKDWRAHVADMRKAAQALKKGVREGKSDAVKAAANSLNNACNNCHTDFRDAVDFGGRQRAFPADVVNEDVLTLTRRLEANKDVLKEAAAVAKAHQIEHVMGVFKAKDKGGIGLGEKGTSIEERIARLSKHELGWVDVRREKDDLLKLARVSIAVAAVAGHQQPAKPLSVWRAKEWKRYTEDMTKAGLALEGALGGNDTKKVKAAALKLNNACNNCHADLRDN
jgi:cytochrome c556